MFPYRDYKKYGLTIDSAQMIKAEMACICPQCNQTRTHPGQKSCSVNQSTGLWHCHHCGASGFVPTPAEERDREQHKQQRRPQRRSNLRVQATRQQNYLRPAWTEPANGYELESAVAHYVLSRGLDLAVGRQLRVTSEGGRIVFNYFDQGRLINRKWRTLDKRFELVKGAELIPWNADSLLGIDWCCITEGEFDAWAMVQSGYPNTVSSPNGAQHNVAWIDRFVESHLADKRQIVLALDCDEQGRVMRDELVRRLGFNRCLVVQWDEGCKDANDELLRYGIEGVQRCVSSAKPMPLQYTYSADDVRQETMDLFHNGVRPGLAVGLKDFDELMTFEPGRYMVVTGRPGDGKSEFVDELVLRLALRHGWKACYFSPENVPVTYHIRKLSERLTSYRFSPSAKMTDALAEACITWQSQNICYIVPDDASLSLSSTDVSPEEIDRAFSTGEVGDWDVHFRLHDILECVHRTVIRCGIRVAVLDPLNRIDYSDLEGANDYERLNQLNSILSRFAVLHGILLILVAHPRKVNRSELSGSRRHVEMNDISGTSEFGSKSDYCLVVDRDDDRDVVNIYVEKVKFKHLGTRGHCTLHYEKQNGRYLPCKVQRIPPDPMDPNAKPTYNKLVEWEGCNVPWIETVSS